MTMMTSTSLAAKADYADALLTARRAKNGLFVVLLLILLLQITIFFLVRFDVVRTGVASNSLQPAVTTTQPEGGVKVRNDVLLATLQYVTDLAVFGGTTLGVVLWVTILLMTLIMLVGRLIGVTHMTSAVVWSALLLVLLFPWQVFFNRAPASTVASVEVAASSVGSTIVADRTPTVPDFYIPGVLYTWPELMRDAHFEQRIGVAPMDTKKSQDVMVLVLKYARFVGFPVLALLILLSVHVKSGRGARFALGESDVQMEVAPVVREPL